MYLSCTLFLHKRHVSFLFVFLFLFLFLSHSSARISSTVILSYRDIVRNQSFILRLKLFGGIFQGRKWIIGVAIFFLIKKATYLKEFCTVVVDTSNVSISIFMASMIDIVGKELSLSVASIICWTTFFRYFAFIDLITQWFMVCREDVLGGKKKKRLEQILILLSLGELGSYLRLI